MALRIYNTASRKKEVFSPMNEGVVTLYVCGVTTYDRCHIGHGRAMVIFDVVYRELRRRGFDVKFVRNYTDVDDKIIRRAQEEGVSAQELADRYVVATREDVNGLGCLPPTHEPRVTEHIPEIITLVQRLIDGGHAYEVNGDVYFAIESFEGYGKLSGRSVEGMRSGARIEVNEQKRNPMDFALWKASKTGEPSWNSPWGAGRPGWHIECSAMSSLYLGESFDIHGGGSDLIFPHHETEIAQSEAASGMVLARYWMHNGMITVNQEKMAKSLKNFVTVGDALARFHRETVRIFLISTHYRSPVDFSTESLEFAETRLERLYHVVGQAYRLIGIGNAEYDREIVSLLEKKGPEALFHHRRWSEKEGPWRQPREGWSQRESELFELILRTEIQLAEAMDDDFNTARALGNLFELARGIGRFVKQQPQGSAYCTVVLGAAVVILQGFCREVLGVLTMSAGNFRVDLNRRRLVDHEITELEIASMLALRKKARDSMDWVSSDRIRDQLSHRGILVEDGSDGTNWRVVSRMPGSEGGAFAQKS